MKNIKFSRTLFLLVVLTCTTVFSWISLTILNIFKEYKPIKIPNSILEPLNPKIDTTVIDGIAQKEVLKIETTSNIKEAE